MDAYEELVEDAVHRCVRTTVRRVDELPVSQGPHIAIHRSKHRYWNLCGHLVSNSPRSVVWDARGICTTVCHGATGVDVEVSSNVDPVMAGEAVFHALRSLALYLRCPGHLLHASAVLWKGRAVAFVGHILAGKTTILADLSLRTAAIPFSNDRLLVQEEDVLLARSWPSYSSFCEGTLLRYPELMQAAEWYESDECPYRTRRWFKPLQSTFRKEQKRAYPPLWFRMVSGKAFRRRAPLGGVVFVSVTPKAQRFVSGRIDLGRQADDVAERLEAVRFDNEEPSFLAWHDLPLHGRRTTSEQLVSALEACDIAVYEVAIPVHALTRMHTFLSETFP